MKNNIIEVFIIDKEIFYNSFNNKKLSSDLGNYIYNEALIFNRNESFQINIKTKFDLAKNEKNEILLKNNLPLNYLKPIYECNICNDTGYVLKNNYKTELCNCLKQRLLNISYNKSNMSNLGKENFNTFN